MASTRAAERHLFRFLLILMLWCCPANCAVPPLLDQRFLLPYTPGPSSLLENECYKTHHCKITPTSTMFLRDSNISAQYEALVVIAERPKVPSIGISAFDIKHGKSWQLLDSYPVHDLLCSPLKGWYDSPFSTLALSPSRRELFLYFAVESSSARSCHSLFMWMDGQLSTISMQDNGFVPHHYNSMTTIRFPGDSATGTYYLVSFGGATCRPTLSVDYQPCSKYSNQIWMMKFLNGTHSAGQWEHVSVHNESNSSIPVPRIGMSIFTSGSSLLLYGGITINKKNYNVPLCDFWKFDFQIGQWENIGKWQLDCNQRDQDHSENRIISSQVAFQEDTMMMLLVSGQILVACDMTGLKVACSRAPNDHSVPYPFWSFTALSSNSQTTYIFSSDKVDMCTVQLRYVLSHGSIVRRRVLKRELLSESLPHQFPGGTDCLSPPPIAVHSVSPNFPVSYLFFGGFCFDARLLSNGWKLRLQDNVDIIMPVWILNIETASGIGYYTKRQFPSGPRASDRVGHTVISLSPSVCVMYGGKSYQRSSAFPFVHCFYTQSFIWISRNPGGRVKPCVVANHIAFKHNSTAFIVHGGICASGVIGELWLFTFSNLTSCTGSWTNISDRVVGGVLPRLFSHTAVKSDNFVVLFGGKWGWSEFANNSLILLHVVDDVSKVQMTLLPVLPSLIPRYHHSLSFHTNNSLLVLGGRGYFDHEYITTAQLISLEMANSTHVSRATTAKFFSHGRLSYHHVVNGLVFSGLSQSPSRDSLFLAIPPGKCPRGYGKTFSSADCSPCPVGSYSSILTTYCKSCPKFSTTNSSGATACYVQSPCAEQFCHNHGVCFESPYDPSRHDERPSAYCKCSSGYLPHDNCRMPVVYLMLLAVVLFVLLVVFSALGLRKYLMKDRDLEKKEIELQQKHRDWRVAQKKVDQLNTGTRIQWSDLQIKKTLAKGRFSRVYLAELSDMNVVVKRFPSYFIPSSPCDEFVQEAETLRSMRHPNIVFFLGAGKDPKSGRPFLVTEYLRRGSLYDVLHDDDCDISHPDVIRFALDAAKGMRYLHGSNPPRVHRDLKSPNLLVSDKWVVKVGDLETARFLAILDVQQEQTTSQPLQAEIQVSSFSVQPVTAIDQLSSGKESESLSTPLLTHASTVHGETYKRYSQEDAACMTSGIGTNRWRSPESLTMSTYNETSDIYR